MKNFEDLFKKISTPANYPQVKIPFIKGETVPQQAMPRVADTQKPKVQKVLEDMMELGVLERSSSPASSRFLLVKKPDGSYRLTVDLRELNQKSESVKETMPTAKEILTQTKGAKVFCTLDLAKFFYQLPLAPSSRYLTAMSTPVEVFANILVFTNKSPILVCIVPFALMYSALQWAFFRATMREHRAAAAVWKVIL